MEKLPSLTLIKKDKILTGSHDLFFLLHYHMTVTVMKQCQLFKTSLEILTKSKSLSVSRINAHSELDPASPHYCHMVSEVTLCNISENRSVYQKSEERRQTTGEERYM